MKRTTRLTIVGAAVIAVAGGIGVAAVNATGDGDDDEQETPISGAELERASAAALASTGGGTVTETEVGDEDSYYEVEVTLDDGSQVDVQLDRDFNVVSSSADAEDDAGDTDD
jgi:uncharacterized membrane protein YkoI